MNENKKPFNWDDYPEEKNKAMEIVNEVGRDLELSGMLRITYMLLIITFALGLSGVLWNSTILLIIGSLTLILAIIYSIRRFFLRKGYIKHRGLFDTKEK